MIIGEDAFDDLDPVLVDTVNDPDFARAQEKGKEAVLEPGDIEVDE